MPGYLEYLRSTSTADLVGIGLFTLVLLPGTIFSLTTENGAVVTPIRLGAAAFLWLSLTVSLLAALRRRSSDDR